MSFNAAPRALIVKFGAIGDVLMVIPAARALHLQGYAIDWVCGQVVTSILACYPWINTIVADDRALLKGGLIERVRAIVGLWRQIGSRSYALCATLYYDRRYQLLTLPVRAKRKIVLSRTERATRLTTARHHSDEYARILLGLDDDCRPLSIEPHPPEHLPASPLVARKGTVRIGLVPGGASNMLRQQTLRRWPVTEYKALAQQLIERGYEVVLLGGPDDAWVRPTFEALQVIDVIGQLSLPEVIASFNSCDVVISHDTGPLHLAGLSTAGLIGLFGPTDPGNFLPRRNGVRGIWGGEGFACRPCYDAKDFPLCSNNGCMQQIKVDLVLFHMDGLLREREADSVRPVMVVLPSCMAESQ